MKLLTLNVGSERFQYNVERLYTGNDREVLFIDWMPTAEHGRDVVRYQVEIVESTPSDVQFIIFDRYSSLTEAEVDFFKGKGAILLEPVMMPRDGFQFMPYFIDKIDLPLDTWDQERMFDFGYIGDTLPLSAEVALLRSLKHAPTLKLGVTTNKTMNPERLEAISELMTVGHHHISRFNSTLLTFDEVGCYKGRLPDIRSHMLRGTVPLIHHENRWFHSLFKNFIMYDWHDVSWYKSMKKLNYGFMDEMYKNMELYLPEMITDNFVESIVGMVK